EDPAAATDESQAICVVNPWGWPQRSFYLGSSSTSGAFVGDAIYASCADGQTIEALIDVSGMGFSASRVRPDQQSAGGLPPGTWLADGWRLRNEYFEAEIDPQSGGIKRLSDFRTRGNLCSQQLAMRLPTAGQSSETPVYTSMIAESCELTV